MSPISVSPLSSTTPALRTAALRVLDARDRDEVAALLARDPVAHVFVTARVRAAGFDPWRLGGELWGFAVDGTIESLCYAGANLVPVEATPEALKAFAERARRQGRRCSSIVGPADEVLAMWELLEPVWGAPREVRSAQPLMATGCPPLVAGDPYVRRVRLDEIDVVMPACVAMFTEEVGVSPLVGDGGVYRSRVTELVASGRAFARIENGEVVFKAEVGAVTTEACQVQGVWVTPRLRGQGFGSAGMAAVVRLCLDEVAPVVSLYVNDFNASRPSRRRRRGSAIRVGRRDPVLADVPAPWASRAGLLRHRPLLTPVGPISSADPLRKRRPPWLCACRRCSCAPCARIRRTPRSRATGCSSAPATCAASRRASSAGCRWATACSATSSG